MRSPLILATILALCWGASPVPAAVQESEAAPDGAGGPEIVVPEGTVIPISLMSFLNTRSSQAGDPFYAETMVPIWIGQRLVIPQGALIRGTVTEVVRPGKVKGRGRLSVRFDSVQLPSGVSRPLAVSLRSIHGPGLEKLDRSRESVEMDSSKAEDAGAIASTTAQGAVIGAVAKGWRGMGVGAGAGAAAGMIATFFVRGPELVLQPGTAFDLELKRPLRFAPGELGPAAAQPRAGRRYPLQQAQDRRIRPPTYARGYGFFIPWLRLWF